VTNFYETGDCLKKDWDLCFRISVSSGVASPKIWEGQNIWF